MEDRSVLDRPARLPDLALSDADVYFGDPARPVVVLVHGGFWRPEWDRTHLRPMAAALAGLGWPVFMPEYRRIPGDPSAAVDDVRQAIAAVGRDVIVMGHSAGGHLALLVRPPRRIGTIALAPVADLTLARELDLDDGAVNDFLGAHPLEPFQPGTPDAVLVHGTADRMVPLRLSEAYAARHPGSRLMRVDGAGHFALIDPLSPAWPNVIDELHRLLT
jgi:acetyl esterase/lipase